MSNGWIALHRQILDTDLWTSEKFTRGQAWIDLVMLANHKDGYIRVRGIKIAVKRGQCGYSEQRLSDRWGWSRGKVRRFFDELEADNQITRETDNKKTVITICNYCKYQDKLKPDGTTNEQQTEQQTDNKRYSNNNGNNGNNGNNIGGGVKKTPTRSPVKKGTRLSEDWEVSEKLGAPLVEEYVSRGWGRQETFDFLLKEQEKFKDYWIAKTGKDATKLDWDRTFKNWVRRAEEYMK